MAVDPTDRSLNLSSIPVVDLRLFSQSELTSLSLFSEPSFDLRRSDDVVDPKIDRSIFNESAGSRKQTYSRLRLARRPSDASSAPGRRRRPSSLLPDDDDVERRGNDQIVFFIRKLFAAASGESNPEPTPPSSGARKAVPDRSVVVYGNRSEAVKRNAVVVDVAVQAQVRRDDPLAAELRRKTEGKGLGTREELLAYLEGLGGQWGSDRKKRKIVDATEIGDALPAGWKISISLKKRGRRAWLICRKYISPNGQEFESFKDVSSYLQSPFSPQDASQRSTCIDKSSQLSTQSTAGPTDIAKDGYVSHPVIPISSSAPMFSVSTKHENQVVSFSANNHAKSQQWNTLECQKCKLSFNDKDSFVEHLLSFHRKKARKFGLHRSVSDGVIMRDGKYVCQFCHKSFEERRRYNGHVGIHVKYYGKSLEALPDDTTEQENNDKSSSAMAPSTSSEVDASFSIEKEKILETSTATFNGELNGGFNSKQVVDAAVVDSSKCSALEITQEMSASMPVDEHEIADCRLLDPAINCNANDVKMQPCLDIAARLLTNEETALCDVSGETTFLPTSEETAICDVSAEKELCPTSLPGETSELGNKSERDLCLFSLFGETSELSNKPERSLEIRSIVHPFNVKTCVTETSDDIFSSTAKELMLGETEKSVTEKACSSAALSDNEKICSMDRSADGILACSTKKSVLDESEKCTNQQKSGVRRSLSVSDEVVTEMGGNSGGENLLQNVVADTSLLLSLQSSFFPILDSDKGAEQSSSAGRKLEKLSDFEELRLDDIDTSKFGFATAQDSSSLSEAPMDLTYMVDFEQGLDPSIQFEWDMVLPKTDNGHQSRAVCSWCSVEFNLGDVNPEIYSDSVGFLCPNCKAKGSVQLSALDNGFSMNSDQL